MSTRTNRSVDGPNRAKSVDKPAGLDAVAYWLEDDEGYPIWFERPTPRSALVMAARGVDNGVAPNTLVLVARTPAGERRTVASGEELQRMAAPFKPVRNPSEEAALRRSRKALEGAIDIFIDGASSYWLENAAGERCTPEFSSSKPAVLAAHDAVRRGIEPDDLVLVCHLTDGGRYEIGRGAILTDLARRAAGLPARPRRITDGPPYPTGTSRG